MGKNQRRIQNFLLEPLLQTKIGMYCILISLVFCIFTGGLVFLHINRFDEIASKIVTVDVEVKALFADYIGELRFWIVGLLALYLSAMIAVSIIYTHKLVGPTYAFKRHLKALIAKNYKVRTHLRKNDAFKEVAELLNELSDKMESPNK